jgi:phosphoglycolate phosphatase
MPAYRLVIFDFDGTLADSAAWTFGKLNEIGKRFGMRHVTPEEIEMLRGRSNRDVISYLGVPLWKLPGIAAEFRRRMAREAGAISLFPGIGEMLTALRAGDVRTAIVSSNAEENIRRILGLQNATLIDDYACGASLFGKARKLRAVVERSGIARAETLFIGDETRDIEAAREAGVASGAVLWGYATSNILRAFKPSRVFAAVHDVAELAH